MTVAHPVTPFRLYDLRNTELNNIANEARRSEFPVMIFGDFNCSPWSYYFSRLLSDDGLQDSERGFGLQPSCPSPIPFIPIDHCVTTTQFVTRERKICESVGPDHLPVLFKLELHALP